MQQESDHKLTDETCVSVVIPYSPEHTPSEMLQEAKQSVESQTVATELIVIKDTDQRGPAWARNQGLRKASTQFVAFLDADDLWKCNKLTRQLQKMNKTNAGLCVEGYDRSTKKFILDIMMGDISSITSSIIIDINSVTGEFDESLNNKEDHLFLVESAMEGGVCLCPDLINIRKQPSGVSVTTPAKQTISYRKEFAEKCFKRIDWLNNYEREYYAHYHFRNGRTWYYNGYYRRSINSFVMAIRNGSYFKTIPALILSIYKMITNANQ
jgi:glycosyltransferase involved in cell wall biosynthesis